MKVWRRVNSWQREQKTQDKKGVCLFKEVKPSLLWPEPSVGENGRRWC